VCDRSDPVLLAILPGEHRATNTVSEKFCSLRAGHIADLQLVTAINAIILTTHRRSQPATIRNYFKRRLPPGDRRDGMDHIYITTRARSADKVK
jgi:hypothetical protein